MSTILDSLKKSSDKRDGHQQTSINSFNFSSSKKTSKSGVLMVIILMAMAAATLYYGYNYIKNQQNSSENTSITENTNEEASKKQSNEQNQITAEKNAANQNKNHSENQLEKLEKPNSEAVKKQLLERIAKNKQDLGNSEKVVDNRVDNVNPKTQVIAVSNADTKSNSKQNNNDIVEVSERTTENKPIIKLTMPDEAEKQQNSITRENPKPKVTTQKYPFVYQLPFNIRKEIPKFNLNIHIYDEDPSSRVVVINGKKFEVNDLIEEQVLVKEIIREGVVLEFNGSVFLIPVL